MNALGNYLKGLRQDKTLGQIEKTTGVDKGYLSKIERGERKPKPDMLGKISEAYGANYEHLMELCGYKVEDPIIIRRLKSGVDKMTAEQQEKMINILKQSFDELFDDDNDKT